MTSGTSLFAILSARPSAIAVLPTPGSPTRQGLFFVLRMRICMTRLISSSRPMTGSILPSLASSVRFLPNFSRVLCPPFPPLRFLPPSGSLFGGALGPGRSSSSLKGLPSPSSPSSSSDEDMLSWKALTKEFLRPSRSAPPASRASNMSEWLLTFFERITNRMCSGPTAPRPPVLRDNSAAFAKTLLTSILKFEKALSANAL